MINQLVTGTRGLVFAYALALVPMLLALYRRRAPWTKFLRAPLVAIVVVLFVGIVVALLSLVPLFDTRSGLFVIINAVATVCLGGAAGLVLADDNSSADPVHRRGAFVRAFSLQSPGRHRGESRASGAGVTLAGVPVPLADETKHFKLIGTTGTGKSTAIRELLTAALARGDRAVIADPDGGYLDRFYDASRGDVILNPFDGAARKWDLFGEIVNDQDVDQIARSLIPHGGDPDRIWCEYARTFFTEVVRQMIRAGERSDAELYRLVTAARAEELRVMLARTAAGPFVAVGNEKMFGSIRSVASSAVRALQYTIRQEAPAFSVREWIRQDGAGCEGGMGGVLFLPYKAGEIAALGSAISAWMRLGIFEAMDRAEGDQRLWFVIDELDALGEIDGLKDALARLRKFGGRCVLGFQSIAQVSGLYGRGMAETIVENCGNTLILRCSASEHGGTAEFASKLIGQREVMHTMESVSRRTGEWRSTTSTAQQLKIEPAVMASEIERLPDLDGFLKTASRPDWYRVRLSPEDSASASRRPPSIDKRRPVLDASTTKPPVDAPVIATGPRSRKPRESAAKYANKRKVKAANAEIMSPVSLAARTPLDASPGPKNEPAVQIPTSQAEFPP
jgi:hypothetical protein